MCYRYALKGRGKGKCRWGLIEGAGLGDHQGRSRSIRQGSGAEFPITGIETTVAPTDLVWLLCLHQLIRKLATSPLSCSAFLVLATTLLFSHPA